jgi:uncharacterized protein YgiB involved in biofilm formation
MKRSQAVRLALLGAGAGALITFDIWANRGEEAVAADLFTSPDLCKISGRYTASQCDQAYADAAKLDEQKAVTYKGREDCEADFTPGGCHEVTTAAPSAGSGSLTSLFVPTMAGFLIGRALSSSALPAEPLYRSCAQATNPDECRRSSGGGSGFSGGGGGSGGGFFTRSGYRVSTSGAGSAATVSSGAFSSAPRGATLSRGGFGARAAAVSARA